MNEEDKKRLTQMPRGQQEARFNALRQKLGIAEPKLIAGGKKPIESSLEEHEEYQFLKKLLGFG